MGEIVRFIVTASPLYISFAMQSTLEYFFSSRLTAAGFFDLFLSILVVFDRSQCYSTYSWYILPCFLQLRLPFAVGYVLATAVAYCQGVGEWTGG